MTGMFQSSSIASGSASRHASNAWRPSAASLTSNENSSTIFRANDRITFESSTSKHDFIVFSTPVRLA